MKFAEIAPLVTSFGDVLELTPSGPVGLPRLELIASTRWRTDQELLAPEPYGTFPD